MAYEFALTPQGHVVPLGGESEDTGLQDDWTEAVVRAFSETSPAGLFAMAAARPAAPLAPSTTYWRDFACRYLGELCRTPDVEGVEPDPIDPPYAELTEMLLSAPPMRGAEYLSTDVLGTIWRSLDEWARSDMAAFGKGLNAWLKHRAPLWHQVGRVCFHLAENKRDFDYPFAFLATYAPGLSASGRVMYKPLSKALREYAGARNKKVLLKLLVPVQRASTKSELARELTESGDLFHPLAWTPAEAYRFLKEIPIFEESGILVRLPDWWRKRSKPRVSVSIGEKQKSRFGADAMLDFHLGVALGDESLTPDELRTLMQSDDGLVFIKGQWVEVNREKLEEALAHWQKIQSRAGEEGISFLEGMRLLAGAPRDLDSDETTAADHDWVSIHAGTWLDEVLAGLRDLNRLETINVGESFRGSLRPYQETGVKWLWLLTRLGLGACLADDMGLGKTVQVLALLLAIREEKGLRNKPSLLVLPASLLGNWKAEIDTFTPTIHVRFLHPSESKQEDMDAVAADPEKALQGDDAVLTTYGMVARRDWFRRVKWHMVILDEAQAIKNPSARQTRTIKQLQCDARIALTGTPVENRLSDLWSIFDFLCPGLLGSETRFMKYVKTLEKKEHANYTPLRNLIRPYILRRLKTDRAVITDLPEKTEVKAWCGLSKRQAALYSAAVEELKHALYNAEGMKRRGLVLAYLMKFKQICNHPGHFLGNGEYAPGDSGKFARLRDLCEVIGSREEKVLVFTQFREVTQALAEFLAGIFGREGLILHGGTPVKRRKGLIEAFQSETGAPFFVLSLRAGGTGLNLTAASHVIHFDRWWNPAVENQATDRAFRIGQKRNVLVHKFVCRGTVEEKIDALIEDKIRLAHDLLEGGGETLLTEMSNEELLETVSLDLDKAFARDE